MILRPMKLPDDLQQTLMGIRDFISRMDYHDFLPDSDEELVDALQRLLVLDCVEITVMEHEQNLVGGIGISYAPCIWNPNIINAEEFFIWVSKDAPHTTLLRIIRRTRERMRQNGCQLMTLKSLTSSPPTIDKLYRQMDLRPVETSYMGPC